MIRLLVELSWVRAGFSLLSSSGIIRCANCLPSGKSSSRNPSASGPRVGSCGFVCKNLCKGKVISARSSKQVELLDYWDEPGGADSCFKPSTVIRYLGKSHLA